MPTIQKPQLDYASFPWHEQSDKFQKELEAQRAQVLERSGFNREFGNSGGSPSANEEQEGAASCGLNLEPAARMPGSRFSASRIARASGTSLREKPTSAAVGFASYICDSKSVRFDCEMTVA
jgi:hypothetical protein